MLSHLVSFFVCFSWLGLLMLKKSWMPVKQLVMWLRLNCFWRTIKTCAMTFAPTRTSAFNSLSFTFFSLDWCLTTDQMFLLFSLVLIRWPALRVNYQRTRRLEKRPNSWTKNGELCSEDGSRKTISFVRRLTCRFSTRRRIKSMPPLHRMKLSLNFSTWAYVLKHFFNIPLFYSTCRTHLLLTPLCDW